MPFKNVVWCHRVMSVPNFLTISLNCFFFFFFPLQQLTMRGLQQPLEYLQQVKPPLHAGEEGSCRAPGKLEHPTASQRPEPGATKRPAAPGLPAAHVALGFKPSQPLDNQPFMPSALCFSRSNLPEDYGFGQGSRNTEVFLYVSLQM